MQFSAFIEIKPVAKQAPARGKYGKPYTPAKTRKYEQAISWLIYKSLEDVKEKLPLFGIMPFNIKLDFVFKKLKRSKMQLPRPDVDNLVKAFMDGAAGKLFENDKQAVHIVADKKWTEKPDDPNGIYFCISDVV